MYSYLLISTKSDIFSAIASRALDTNRLYRTQSFVWLFNQSQLRREAKARYIRYFTQSNYFEEISEYVY